MLKDEPEEKTQQIEVDLIILVQDQNKNTGNTFAGSIYITSESDNKLNEIITFETPEDAEHPFRIVVQKINHSWLIFSCLFAIILIDK